MDQLDDLTRQREEWQRKMKKSHKSRFRVCRNPFYLGSIKQEQKTFCAEKGEKGRSGQCKSCSIAAIGWMKGKKVVDRTV